LKLGAAWQITEGGQFSFEVDACASERLWPFNCL
jgi:hypothetical protein